MRQGIRKTGLLGIVLLGASLVGGTACGTGGQSAGSDSSAVRLAAERQAASPSGEPTGSYPAESSPSAGASGPVDTQGLEKAAAAAMAAVEGAKLISIEAEGDGKVWEVHLAEPDGTEQQLDVDAASGRVVAGPAAEQDDASDKAELAALVKAATLDYKEAAQKVAEAVPEGRITELNLDSDDGKPVWEADVVTADGAKREVKVNAKDGTVQTDAQNS
ncbi:PepSY domain-containing protein [Nonomuraea sp. NPDC050310]|uniref:PepSY domain-containing protein n=1 Tax=unclassified Nonomuraea TaxID=2593643 RepID=UPI00340956B7